MRKTRKSLWCKGLCQKWWAAAALSAYALRTYGDLVYNDDRRGNIVENKKCRKCKEIKSVLEFHKCARIKDGYSSYCKPCNNIINKKAYHNHWQDRRKAIDKYHYSKIEQLRLEVDNLKIKIGCQHCGYKEYAVALEFHHIDINTKINSIASMINRKVKKTTLLDEIAKCVVLCANCHRLLHNNIISNEQFSTVSL